MANQPSPARDGGQGVELSANGAHVKHPVIIVPGVTSTALELWKAAPCLDNNFRKRVWGDTLMMETMLLNFECWMKHSEWRAMIVGLPRTTLTLLVLCQSVFMTRLDSILTAYVCAPPRESALRTW